jgi:hypothetical protein
MTHGILEIRSMNEQNKNLVRSASVAADAVDNGNIVVLTAGGETNEVWAATKPATATLASGAATSLWIVSVDDTSTLVDGTLIYRGLSARPGDVYAPAASTIRVIKPEVGNVFVMTADDISNARTAETFVVAQDASYKWVWSSTAISGLSAKLIEVTYLPIPDGSMGLGRAVAYKFEIVALA